ncbi:hypothetical protein [Candidatus Lucifugimonas marina]|uniref:LppP/LprE family lipoprotein n=1 Tax=Candidatus Lucifugimonas marina TaxID=3038979 RepID=A0AAJ6CSU0_9CHLR|nr:hypothetical protein [SAR202 cluster bacterium JH702]MDG0870698.1 hypothetical protein [SAR202 cluster bacterium JH639]WFG34782.1 hypothetical protein GKN94_03495 [SAR202 cluster bacterium JH545]WFG38722.1 hypothetical protein GKO48_03575 [SAR202 cluster bacterium JH1073]
MNIFSAIRFTPRWKLAVFAFTTLAVIACGSNSPAANPTATSTPQPAATFVSIQVTVPSNEPPTPTPIPEGTPSTKGSPRSFPENLKSTEGLTIGPLLTSWQAYLDASVIRFEGQTLDLCAQGNGVALGTVMNGGIVWTIGPPREGMLGNEVFFTLWNPEKDLGGAFVLGYQNDSPVLKLVTNYKYSDTVTPFTYKGDPIPFQSFELTTCLNL